MCVYNGEKYLKEAIESILNQTYQNFEFLIVNDASTDKTSNILTQYQDHRIRIIHNSLNLGLTKSLNIGLREAKGEYIARMDADDISLPERLNIQKKFLDEHKDIVCVGTESIVINKDGKTIGKKKVTIDSSISFRILLINQLIHSATMFRASIVKNIGGYNESYTYAQDYELWSRLNKKRYSIINIERPLIKYRHHQSSITQKSNNKYLPENLIIKTIKSNIEDYIPITEYEFGIIYNFIHRYKISNIIGLIHIYRLLLKLRSSYLIKNKLYTEDKKLIDVYIRREVKRAIKCFLITAKNRLFNIIKFNMKNQDKHTTNESVNFDENECLEFNNERFFTVSNIVKKSDPEKILDIGICTGLMYQKFLPELLNKGSIYGTDINQDFLDISQKRGAVVKKSNLDKEPLPFSDSMFDVVVCDGLLEHSLNPKKLLEEIYRVLKVDGTLILCVPNATSVIRRFDLLRGRSPFRPIIDNLFHYSFMQRCAILYSIEDLMWIMDNNFFINETIFLDRQKNDPFSMSRILSRLISKFVPKMRDLIIIEARKR